MPVLVLFILMSLASAAGEPHSSLPREIFGVEPGMAAAQAHQQLGAIGTLQRKERKRQEVWTLRDSRYDGAILGFDEEQRIRFITAVARKEARIPYASIADIREARHESSGQTHTYRWSVRGESLSYDVIAIGGPEFVQYFSLKRVSPDVPPR